MGFPVAFAAGAVSSVAKRFKTPSDKRAKKVLPGVVSAALAGNLLAIKVLDERRSGHGIASERAVWSGGYNQVASARPDLIAAYQKSKAELPAVDHKSPESAAQSVNANVGNYQPNALEMALAPVVNAGEANEAAAREALATAAERVGVGGGAELARQLRGGAGPLDKLIEFGQKPGGTLALVAGAVVLVVVVARAIR